MAKDFTCALCGEDCTSTWTDAEAEAELRREFGELTVGECVEVCDDCYRMVMALERKRTGPPGDAAPEGP